MEHIMADNDTDSKPQENRQISLRIDETKMVTTYSNTIRTSTTSDEVVLDFGMNLPMQGDNNQPTLLFTVGSRVIMNWQGAKRLAMSMAQVVRAYEERNGEIPLNPQGRPGPQGAAPRLAN